MIKSLIIDYNISKKIKLFRISSGLIPFGSSPVNEVAWWELFFSQLQNIGQKIRNNGMRVSMHPGQYTVINSTKAEVVTRAIDDLNYHAKVLNSLGVSSENKIVMHVGGIYNKKRLAINRFISHYKDLGDNVKQRMVLENDDKLFNIDDVLEIATILKLPVVFDNLHNEVNFCNKKNSDSYWINECEKTWNKKDGNQKVHYSQQDTSKKPGAHSHTIMIEEFIEFFKSLDGKDIDIMLEVKDKNLSAVKCINCISQGENIKALEIEWSKYKYSVLEKSPSDYLDIRKLLRNKKSYTAIRFYSILETALQKPNKTVNLVNAAQHIWGYFKDTASAKEKDRFFKNLNNYLQGKASIKSAKNNLWKLATKYNQQYLLDSYYFVL